LGTWKPSTCPISPSPITAPAAAAYPKGCLEAIDSANLRAAHDRKEGFDGRRRLHKKWAEREPWIFPYSFLLVHSLKFDLDIPLYRHSFLEVRSRRISFLGFFKSPIKSAVGYRSYRCQFPNLVHPADNNIRIAQIFSKSISTVVFKVFTTLLWVPHIFIDRVVYGRLRHTESWRSFLCMKGRFPG
jgi:hypothetical protein